VSGDNACVWNEGNAESSAYSNDFFSIEVTDEEDFSGGKKSMIDDVFFQLQ
jgi:hypothetical protein